MNCGLLGVSNASFAKYQGFEDSKAYSKVIWFMFVTLNSTAKTGVLDTDGQWIVNVIVRFPLTTSILDIGFIESHTDEIYSSQK